MKGSTNKKKQALGTDKISAADKLRKAAKSDKGLLYAMLSSHETGLNTDEVEAKQEQ
jgi:hypothetical protein